MSEQVFKSEPNYFGLGDRVRLPNKQLATVIELSHHGEEEGLCCHITVRIDDDEIYTSVEGDFELVQRKFCCMRCGSDEWEYIDYGGCSVCRPYELRESEDGEES